MDTHESQDDVSGAADRSDNWEEFSPAGLRVLAVDDDKLCLKVISKMLQQCNYEGAPLYPVQRLCGLGRELC